MKILITGANGMLAKAVKEKFKNEELICTDIEDLDITNFEAVQNFIMTVKPDLIINCAAYTAVDKAEEQKELASKINYLGPKNLAIVSEQNNSILAHISTDYVFGGDKPVNEYYSEEDEKNPQTVYGKTKLDGENAIKENCSRYYIFRTAWLYGEGNNFVKTMINLSKNHDEVSVVNDQYGSPTYTVDLAGIIYQAIKRKIPFGIYNSTNIGYTTWYEFTKKIYEGKNINCRVKPVTSGEFPRPAKRPLNSQMSKDKLLNEGILIPEYEDALKRYLRNI